MGKTLTIGKQLYSILVVTLLLSTAFLSLIIGFTLRSSAQSTGLSITTTFQQPRLTEVILDNKTFTQISMPNCISHASPGDPALPIHPLRIVLPKGKEVSDISVSHGNFIELSHDLKNKPIVPQQEPEITSFNGSNVSFVMNEEIYNLTDPVFDEIYGDGGIGFCRGFPILTVFLYPMQYIPKTGKLYYFPDMTVTVDFKIDEYMDLEEDPLLRYSDSDVEVISEMVGNPNSIPTYEPSSMGTLGGDGEGGDGDGDGDGGYQPLGGGDGLCNSSDTHEYVIITNENLNNTVGQTYNWSDLLEHRRAYSGLTATKVTVETIDGCSAYWNGTGLFNDSAAHVREFIKDAYQNWGTEFVVLGGDWDTGNPDKQIVPQRTFYVWDARSLGYPDMPCDLYFSNLDGDWRDTAHSCWGGGRSSGVNDPYAEVYVGRMTVSSAEEVSNFIKKILWYELYAENDFINKTAFFGGNLGWTSTSADYMEEIRNGNDPYFYQCKGFVEWNTDNPLYTFDVSTRKYYDWGDSIPGDYQTVINNDDVCIINHLSHGNPTFALDMTNGQLASLSNSKFFFAFSGQCLSGRFTAGDTTEKTLTCIYDDNGAFGLIWNTGYGWGRSDNTNGTGQFMQRHFWDYFFDEQPDMNDWIIGGAYVYSKDEMSAYVDIPTWHYAWCYNWYSTHLFGDPAQKLRIGTQSHDIAVVDIDVDDHVLPNTPDVPVNTTISNLGANDEVDITVSFMVDDVEVDNETIGFLGSGNSTILSFNWTTPSPPEHGYALITVNASIVAGENITANNEHSQIVVIGPDISVSDLAVSDVLKWTNTNFSAYIQNLGASDENNIVVDFKVDSNTEDSTVLSLSAGSGQSVTFQWDGSGCTVGDHVVEIYAQPVTDENYTLNQNESDMIFVYAPINMTDLSVNPTLQEADGFVNISCNIVSEDMINTVKINIPSVGNVSMNAIGDIYYYNQTYDLIGDYLFTIWASTQYISNSVADSFTIYNPGVLVHNVEKDTDYYTIQNAINDADSGNTLQVSDGMYYGGIIVNESVNLVGASNVSTVISGANSSCGFEITSSGANISNFKFIFADSFGGVNLGNSAYSNISFNNFSKNSYGVVIGEGDYNHIFQNVFFNNSNYGVALESDGEGDGANSTAPIHNSIFDNDFYFQNGISLWGGKYTQVHNNSFIDSWDDTAAGIYARYSSFHELHDTEIFDNTFDLSGQYAINVWGTSGDLTIHHNDITLNSTDSSIYYTSAIMFRDVNAYTDEAPGGAQQVRVHNNTITTSRDGIRLIDCGGTSSSNDYISLENNTIICTKNEYSDFQQASQWSLPTGIRLTDWGGNYNTDKVKCEYQYISGFNFSFRNADGGKYNHIHHSDLVNCVGEYYGAWCENSLGPVDARNCYWGAANGPGGDPAAATGDGTNVSLYVPFVPYASSPFFPYMNQSPVISGENPVDGATEVSLDLNILSVTIEDPEGDVFNWSIETSPDIGTSSGNGESNGSKSCSISGLSYSTTYYWFVNATDVGSGEWTNETYWFTTESLPVNDAPQFSSETPSNESTSVSINLSSLSVTIEDPEGDSFDWTIEASPDIGSNSGNGASNGSKSCSISGLNYATTYYWYVNATDAGSGNWTNEIYWFTIESEPNDPPLFSNEIPSNESIDVSIGISSVSLVINDPDGDTFNWAIETSPDVGSSSGNDASNGTKTCNLATPLNYSTTYYWFVNATDSGSGEWTKCIYSFTTEVDPPPPNAPPTFSNEMPSDESPNVSINLASINVNITDLEEDNFSWNIGTSPDVGNNSGYGSGGIKVCNLDAPLSYSTTYYWFVNATDDGSGSWTNETYYFTTEAEPVNNPPTLTGATPGNGSTGVSISTASLSITIEDPEGDSFDWGIETSPDIGTSSVNNDSNGTKSCSISGLSYSTTYYWYVSCKDVGSGSWNNKTYWFTTLADEGGGDPPGGGGGPPPPSGDGEIEETGQNNPPEVPDEPSGSIFVEMGVTYIYSTKTFDIDGDLIRYRFDWGDGNYSEWSGFVASNISVNMTHYWTSISTYDVRVIAQDENGSNSSWSEALEVVVSQIAPGEEAVVDVNVSDNVSANQTITFDASGCYISGGVIISYYWDFGDGAIGSGIRPVHVYKKPGQYNVTLIVMDSNGNNHSQTIVVTISAEGEASEEKQELLLSHLVIDLIGIILAVLVCIIVFFRDKVKVFLSSHRPHMTLHSGALYRKNKLEKIEAQIKEIKNRKKKSKFGKTPVVKSLDYYDETRKNYLKATRLVGSEENKSFDICNDDTCSGKKIDEIIIKGVKIDTSAVKDSESLKDVDINVLVDAVILSGDKKSGDTFSFEKKGVFYESYRKKNRQPCSPKDEAKSG